MRYRVSDLPAQGLGAFCPTLVRNPEASSRGLVSIFGNPGVIPQPAPAPQRDWLPSLTIVGGINSAQGSMVAPDVRYRDKYVANATNMGPEADAGIGMARRRFAELPIPAIDPVRLPRPVQSVPPVGGRGQIPWPRAFQRWPTKAAVGG